MPDCPGNDSVEDFKYRLITHRDFHLISGILSPEEVDRIQNWEIQDSYQTDVFVVTYPKSGTIWLQQILSLIEARGDIEATIDQLTSEHLPWIELIGNEEKFISATPPRIRVTHLQHRFVPISLRQGTGKVIYWQEIQKMFWCPTTTSTNMPVCWRLRKTSMSFMRSSWRDKGPSSALHRGTGPLRSSSSHDPNVPTMVIISPICYELTKAKSA
ncbi:hypothetical protein SRHO_G00242900 [Serrasalmus rhombeus]